MHWLDEHVRLAGALSVLVLLAFSTVGLVVLSRASESDVDDARESNRELVRALGLTDLAFWSEASYCRHPAVADRFAAWGDHPAALDHFPAGSLVPPPVHLPVRPAAALSAVR